MTAEIITGVFGKCLNLEKTLFLSFSRYMAGQKEYEVELQFTSGILSYPSRTNIDEENIDGEEPIFGSRMDLKSQSASSSRRGSRFSIMGWVLWPLQVAVSDSFCTYCDFIKGAMSRNFRQFRH